jgi:hypothetical protein
MGGWGNGIGKYYVQQMDYDYDKINKIHSKEKLEKFMLEVELSYPNPTGDSSIEETVKIPLTELHDVIPDEEDEYEGLGYYTISWDNEEKSLRNWLWREIQKRGWKVIGEFRLRVYIPDIDYSKLPLYYLNSELMSDDSDIKISTTPRLKEVTKLEELDWLAEKGFQFK